MKNRLRNILVLLFLVGGIGNGVQGQICALNTNLACPGDTIIAIGAGFYGTDSITIDGVAAQFDCAWFDGNLCAGPGSCGSPDDTLGIIIPYGVGLGSTVTLIRYESPNPPQTFTLDICEGLVPDTACIGDSLDVFYNFEPTPTNYACKKLKVGGCGGGYPGPCITIYDNNGGTSEPPATSYTFGTPQQKLTFMVPAGINESIINKVDVDRYSGTDPEYDLFVLPANDAYFEYPTDTLCRLSTTPVAPSVFPTAPVGGTFGAAGGLILNPTTGEITPNLSTVGSYTVTFTPTGKSCMGFYSATVVIADPIDPSTNYTGLPQYCLNQSNPFPSPTNPGGNYWGSSGVVVNSSTGELDLSSTFINNGTSTDTIFYLPPGACTEPDTVLFTVGDTANAHFTWPLTDVCITSGVNPIPVPDSTGGTFADTSGVLNVSPGTGEIDLNTAIPGSYYIQYTNGSPCPNTGYALINILPDDDASFAYDTTIFCTGGINPIPTVTGLLGGTFSNPPGDVNFVSTVSGEINASTTPIGGPYDILYTTNGSCPSADTFQITIGPGDDPTFSYPDSFYCISGPNPVPDTIVTPGGTFSEPTGNVVFVSTTTGEINLGATTAGGPYTIQYTTGTGCSTVGSFSLRIDSVATAGFSLPRGNTYCVNEPNPTPVITGVGGGTFSEVSGNITFVSTATGEIDLGSCVPGGPYTLKYVLGGSCGDSTSTNIQILAADNPFMAYPKAGWCIGDTNFFPDSISPAGGVFWEPTGNLIVDSTTGMVDVALSTPGGPYLVYYMSPPPCSEVVVDTISLTGQVPAGFFYQKDSLCKQDPFPVPTITGIAGGNYYAIPPMSTSALNPATGIINLDSIVLTSSVNPYTIYYVSPGACPDTGSFAMTIFRQGDPEWDFDATSFCQLPGDTVHAVVTGDPNGGFSFSQLEPGFNTTTGDVIPELCAPGNYVATYSVAGSVGSCPASKDIPFEIVVPDSNSIDYDTTTNLAALFCPGGPNPTPIISGDSSGTFSINPPGPNIDLISGEIDINTAGAGVTYVIKYEGQGNCAAEDAVDTVRVLSPDNAGFDYGGVINYCQSDSFPPPNITGLSGGIFSEATGTLPLDSVTGVVDLSSSPPGTYQIVYSTTGQCPASSTQFVTVQENPATSLVTDLPDSIICQGVEVQFTAVGGVPTQDTYEFSLIDGTVLKPPCLLATDCYLFETSTLPPGQDTVVVTITDDDGCFAKDTVIVQVDATPVGQVLNLPVAISGREAVTFTVLSQTDQTYFEYIMRTTTGITPAYDVGSSQTNSGLLGVGDSAQVTTAQLTTYNEIQAGRVRISIIPKRLGCQGEVVSDTILVNPNNQDFFIPAAITPDGNNLNDSWLIQWNTTRINPADYYIEVFNRLGGHVHTLNSLDEFWNGGFLPDGTYWWVLKEHGTDAIVDKGGVKIKRQ